MADNHNGNRRKGRKADEAGEGNRDADRRYRKATEEYVESGRVDSAAKEARRAVDDERQRRDLEEAERRGRATGPDTPSRDPYRAPDRDPSSDDER